jgi:2-keto-4-pentenoate hydratase/2-oxohepta-3-ene-1,7-dioic acid hydratase in catechol pathway
MGPPITGSRNCFAVGLNYRHHAEESGMEIPPFPMIFTKHTSCINGPFDNIEMRSDIVDYEAELVVVIGKQGKNISNDEAWNHVAGLTVGQDISDRSVQFHATPPQFNLGKSFDTFGPIGPILVSPDEFEDKNSLDLECSVNGELRQKDNTNDLIFDIPYIISYISEFITLEPGDLIFTGTPAGVGATQGKLLKDGDILSTTIQGIGRMENKCVRISDHSNASFIPEFVKGKMSNNDQD